MKKQAHQHSVSAASGSRGFTMLEMLVSLAIFSIVAVIAVGSLVRITGLNRQARSLQDAMTNVSYALESMSRELRMGTAYDCEDGGGAINTNTIAFSPCSGNTASTRTLAFKSSKSHLTASGNNSCQLIYAYRFTSSGSGWKLQKSEQSDCEDSINVNSFSDVINAPDVMITEYELEVSRPASNKGYSWVDIGVKGYAGVREKERHYFDVHTGISQRIAD